MNSNMLQEAGEQLNQQRFEQDMYEASEMAKRNRQRIHDSKIRQQIRESNQELRELESKLRTAYVSKGIRAQLAEKKAERFREKIHLEKEKEIQLKSRQADEILLLRQKKEVVAQQIELRETLQKQMVQKQQQRQLLYQEFLNEKSKLDEIVRRVLEERMADFQERLLKQHNYRFDLDELKAAQERWRHTERQESEAENKRILEFLQQRDEKLEQERRLEKERRLKTSMLADKMCADLEKVEADAREREELLHLLKIEEINEAARLRDREELERKFRLRLKVRLDLDEQRDEREKNKQQQIEEDRQYRADQLQHMAERDKIDQLTAEKRRQKIRQHHADVRLMLTQRQERREMELFDALQQDRSRRIEEAKIQQIIEEERIKILKEHAGQLIGFFPPGVLRDSDKSALRI